MARFATRLKQAIFALAVGGLGMLAGPQVLASGGGQPTVLTGISATHDGGFDRLTFQFTGPVPAHRTARYVSGVTSSSGAPLLVAGSPTLLVSFSTASGRDGHGHITYGPSRRAYPLPGITQVATAANGGGTVSFAVGVAWREPVRIFTLAHPSQVVIEVRTPHRTVGVSDYFFNSRQFTGGEQDASQPVSRPVIRSTQPFHAMQRLFAGPTQAELASGLRFVTSGATGFTNLTMAGGGAQVQLTGGCGTGWSRFTVASEITPTLLQFPWVHWVKIYDSAGQTEHPAGPTDSVPKCLALSAVQSVTLSVRSWVLLTLAILTGLGVLIGLVLSVISVLQGLALNPSLITPSAYRNERDAAKPLKTGQLDRDRAWPFYPFRQATADLARIGAERRIRTAKLWKWPVEPPVRVLLFPFSMAAALCLGIACLTTIVLYGLFTLIVLVCAAVSGVVFGGIVALLRGAEQSWHRVMRTDASCPRCYHVTPRPAYRCSGCSALHRDIRPGRLGLFTRRCECGALLPTLVIRAAWRLVAVCQRCQEPLRRGSAALRDIRIPIFGDTSAGKTRFLYTSLDSLIATTEQTGIAFGFPDERSEHEATLALDLVRSGRDTVKTSVGLPVALTCRLGKGPDSSLVHLFDAPGEYYKGPEMHDSLRFLDHGHGMVYVLDPFSVGSVRDRMTGHNAVTIRLAHAAAGDPETAYGEVVTRLRDSGVQADGQRLAVVVSKADLLTAGGLELPEDSAGIASWLTEMGVHNLVLSARREFAEVRFFAVASQCLIDSEDAVSRRHDPGAPLCWLLASHGVRRLPGNGANRVPHRDPDGHNRDHAGQGKPVEAAQSEAPGVQG